MSFEFKEVDLGPKGKQFKRQERWRHIRKTVLYMIGGAALSLAFSYFSEGSKLSGTEIQQALMIGSFMGFFLTNSPCARGRC